MAVTLGQVMDAMAAQLKAQLDGGATPAISKLQVVSRLKFNPTPPAIDIYPSDPFQEDIAFGTSVEVYFSVRARVTTADQIAGQDLLLSMMDPRSPQSVKQALLADTTFGGTVQNTAVEPPSDYGLFQDPGSTDGGLLGCVWRVGVIL